MDHQSPQTASLAYDLLLDARQLECPLPTIKAKESMDALPTGAVLKILVDNDAAVRNILTFAKSNGYPLFYESKSEEGYSLYIQKN